MRPLQVAVFSDLHLAFGPLEYDLDLPADVDLAIVAGDITAPVGASVRWLFETLVMKGVEVVFVAGNHEHYGQCYEDSMESGVAAAAKSPGVHWLENGETVIDGVRFLGASMWTDFELYGNVPAAMREAALQMNDYRHIHSRDAMGHVRRFDPERTRDIHAASRQWLHEALARHHDGPTVVVTHHCPHPMSIDPRHSGQLLNAAFVSDFGREISEFQPAFWIHGHTHTSFDYVVPGTQTRVICNPRGYARHGRNEVENKAFELFRTIKIGRD